MKAVTFVGLVLLALTSSTAMASPVVAIASTEDMFMHEELLKLPTERSYKTIQSPHGDLIDCVPIHLQPAFDHPKLRGQKPLDTAAPESPKGRLGRPHELPFRQPRLPSADSCPEGTVPIRRTTEKDLLIDDYVRLLKREMARGGRHSGVHVNAVPGHEYAIGIAWGNQFYGAEAVIDSWAPKVDNPLEFSLSQIWLAAGSYEAGNLNTIEAGWQVFPLKYGDNKPRLFIYWTADSYTRTGCYNLECPGFVQTNKDVVIGGALSPVSIYGGPRYNRTFRIWKDPITLNWWLKYDGQRVGYWPATLFTTMANYSTYAEFGGEIFTLQSGAHTTTEMGSGHFAGEGLGRASSFQNLVAIDARNYYTPLPTLTPGMTNPRCYDYAETGGGSWVHYFFYGGPGRNANCP